MKMCSHLGCENALSALGLCSMHYQRRKAERRKVNQCACGCGGVTQYTFVAGHQTRFLSREEQTRRGRLNDGSKQRDRGVGKGYRKVRGRHEHRIAAERKLGRELLPGEIVHHKNGNKKDNAPDNLEIITQSEHIKLHYAEMQAARKAKHGY